MSKADSFYQLGLDYHHANGFNQDDDIAIDYLIKAANLNHFEAKVLCANLLFEQAKNPKSIYYEDGYRQGSELMIEIFRAGRIDLTLPHLLNNPIFNDSCSLEEMQEYYQEAYRLGYRETKFELAKLLYQKGSYLSAEQLFLESIKEDISKESHVYLYEIYLKDEHYNEKKAYTHLKEALRNDYMIDPYHEFFEEDHSVLIHQKYIQSGFSMNIVKQSLIDYVNRTNYADPEFVQWLKTDQIHVGLYFDMKMILENVAYEFERQSEDFCKFIYEPFELTEGYFKDIPDQDTETKVKEKALKKNSGFYQTTEKDQYKSLEFKQIFELFYSVKKIPVLHANVDENEIDQMIQETIKRIIKFKYPDYVTKSIIRLKKFNLFKTLVPSFDFSFTYRNKTYQSRRYAMDDPVWEPVFHAEKDTLNPIDLHLAFEIPLDPKVDVELNEIKNEAIRYHKHRFLLIPLKIITLIVFGWSWVLFISNRLLDKSIYLGNHQMVGSLISELLWYVGALCLGVVLYLFTPIKIYEPSINNLNEIIMNDPEFQLPKDRNKTHFKNQYRMLLWLFILAVIFFIFSGFLPILR